jgi:hypothetical protein
MKTAIQGWMSAYIFGPSGISLGHSRFEHRPLVPRTEG